MRMLSRAATVAALVALPLAPVMQAAPALAQASPGVATALTIPTIQTVDSSMDEAALRDVFTGGFMKHVSELAALNATSITIPEVSFTMTVKPDSGPDVQTSASYKNIVLNNVRNGVAESVSVDATTSSSAGSTIAFGKLSASDFNIGALLALYSLVPSGGADQAMQVLYRNFSFDGGTFGGPTASCTLGKITAAEFSARPLKVSFAELMAASQALQASKDNPPAAAMTTVVGFLTDIFQAFKSEPISIDGLKCSGTGDTGEPFDLAIGGLTMDGYAPGNYPAISVSDVKIGDGGKNTVTLDAGTLKTIDLSGPIAVLEAAGAKLDEAWFTANARALIPAFAGFSFSGLKADVENPDLPGERLNASVANFDVSLGDYVNGIPTKVSTSASNIEVPLPADPEDETAAMLKSMGIERVNLGYEVQAAWDKAAQTIDVTKVSLSGVDLGTFTVGAKVGNASELLFDLNPQIMMMTSLGLTVKSVTLDINDAGFSTIVAAAAAKEQNMDPAAFRAQMGAALEGMSIQVLGSTDSARALGAALSGFISGQKKSLSITLTSKAPQGVPLMQFLAQVQAVDDPMKLGPVLSTMVDITGSAQ